jgi:hypothetical protein
MSNRGVTDVTCLQHRSVDRIPASRADVGFIGDGERIIADGYSAAWNSRHLVA